MVSRERASDLVRPHPRDLEGIVEGIKAPGALEGLDFLRSWRMGCLPVRSPCRSNLIHGVAKFAEFYSVLALLDNMIV
jgi:hypothetical protein